MKFIIQDWAGNRCFIESTWDSFEEAEDFLCVFFDKEGMDYEEWRQEYEIVEARHKPGLKFNYTQWIG